MKWEFGKEKLVYVLNPDGLTESIFVARGEKNEGEYRGKRFTKAGLKAEKKRKQEEMKASLQLATPSEMPITESISVSTGSVSLEEYDKVNDEVKTVSVHIFGSMKGFIILFDTETNDVIKYEECSESFTNKKHVQSIINELGIKDSHLAYFKTDKDAVFFKGFGEIVLSK